jgi:hypothetical protein
MHHGDPAACRLVIRHPDGTTGTSEWVPEQWPPEPGQLVTYEGDTYRIAGIQRENDVTLVTVLPAKRSARRLLG